MKKVMATALCLLIICFVFCGCNDTDLYDYNADAPEVVTEPVGTFLYKPYIKAVIDKVGESEYGDAFGALYDVDADDMEELIMIHYSTDVMRESGEMIDEAVVYSVYTIEYDAVVPLVEENYLFPLAGGPQGSAYILSNSEQTFLGFRYAEINPGDEDTLNCNGNWYIYTLDGVDFELEKECEYSYTYTLENDEEIVDYSNSSVIINGEKSSYEEFDLWLKSFETTEILAYDSAYEEANLDVLIETLE